MQKYGFLFIIAAVALFSFSACQTQTPGNAPNTTGLSSTVGGGAGTPTEAYKQLYEAVQKKDLAKIKSLMSTDSLGFAEFAAAQQNKPVDEVLKNGFIEGNLSPTMPQIRDERIKENFAALEVQNPNGSWQDVGFIKQDGGWKIAVGDMFKGTYQSPGMSKAQQEDMKTNPMYNPNLINANASGPTTAIVPNAPANAPATEPKPAKPGAKDAK
jgi:hypothetical protein